MADTIRVDYPRSRRSKEKMILPFSSPEPHQQDSTVQNKMKRKGIANHTSRCFSVWNKRHVVLLVAAVIGWKMFVSSPSPYNWEPVQGSPLSHPLPFHLHCWMLFGYSLSLSNHHLAVGSPCWDDEKGGFAFVYELLISKTKTSLAQVGSTLQRGAKQFGIAVAVSEKDMRSNNRNHRKVVTVVVGDGDFYSGSVSAYSLNHSSSATKTSSWIQKGQVLGNTTKDSQTGEVVAVSVDGSVLAYGYDGLNGKLRTTGVYQWKDEPSNAWELLNGGSSDGLPGTESLIRETPVALSADGKSLAVVVRPDPNRYLATLGAQRQLVRIYRYDGRAWFQYSPDIFPPCDGQCYNSDPEVEEVELSADGKVVVLLTKQGGYGFGGFQYKVHSYGLTKKYVNQPWTEYQDRPLVLQGEAGSISLSADAKTLVVGEPLYSYVLYSGRVRIFQFEESLSDENSAGWRLVETIAGKVFRGYFGARVALSPDASKLAVTETRFFYLLRVHVLDRTNSTGAAGVAS